MGRRSSASSDRSGAAGSSPDAEAALESRVAELERRVADLESADDASPNPTAPAPRPETAAAPLPGEAETFWALRGLVERTGPEGGVLYTGHVTPPQSESPLSWQMALTAEAINEIDFAEAAPSLAAFTHPVRLSLLQAIYEGTTTVAELSADDRFGTTGQIYHHLKALSAAGWLETVSRGHWRIPPQRVIPLLTLILIGTQ